MLMQFMSVISPRKIELFSGGYLSRGVLQTRSLSVAKSTALGHSNNSVSGWPDEWLAVELHFQKKKKAVPTLDQMDFNGLDYS